jgi:hypothetical protein
MVVSSFQVDYYVTKVEFRAKKKNDKMRCYWEHVREHNGNLKNMLKTQGELDGNT